MTPFSLATEETNWSKLMESKQEEKHSHDWSCYPRKTSM